MIATRQSTGRTMAAVGAVSCTAAKLLAPASGNPVKVMKMHDQAASQPSARHLSFTRTRWRLTASDAVRFVV